MTSRLVWKKTFPLLRVRELIAVRNYYVQETRRTIWGKAGSVAAMSSSSGSEARQKEDLKVQHEASHRQFVIQLGENKALLQYEFGADGQVDLWHTEVPPAFRGRGVAKHLAQAALDHFSSQSTPMVLSCTYLQKYVKDFPQPQHQRHILPL